ncbi:MAG: glutamyl-tRNA reductase [Akkermansiaceae bacterium]|mgnify:CR=1 FL=1|jgi:glutamyl-tRNA reductase|tara:strand:- start:1178 stop:2143 length:966 start_codon:yes stop_codon:yes gene_type:complete
MGLNHKTAPVEVREHFAVPAELLGSRAKELTELSTIAEGVVLSTCNRMEIYIAAEDRQTGVRILREHLEEGRSADEMKHIYQKSGDDAKRHLFALVCGLDSMVLGETEIFGQVKQAYKQALESGATKGVLNKLFQKSFTVGKRIRTQTRIQMGATSVGNVAVDLAEKIFGELKGSHVMIIGAGETSRLVAQSMMSRGASNLTVTNRSIERAQSLAEELNGEAVPFDAWEDTLTKVDVIVSSTGASEPVLRTAQIEAVRRKRKFRPLFLIDIAVPRDIETEAGDIEEVYLYDIDKLQQLASEAKESRAQQVRICEQMIAEEI